MAPPQRRWPETTPQTLVTRRRPDVTRPEGELTDAWFERPRLSPLGADTERVRPVPRSTSNGMKFALVSLGLIGASIAATAFVVAPHAKELTRVPARAATPMRLAPVVEAVVADTEAQAAAAQPHGETPTDTTETTAAEVTTAPPPKPPPARRAADVHFR